MTVEGAAGIVAGVQASPVALAGLALSSVVEGVASWIVIWPFTAALGRARGSSGTPLRGVKITEGRTVPLTYGESRLGQNIHGDHSCRGVRLPVHRQLAGRASVPAPGRGELGGHLSPLANRRSL